MQTDFYRPNYGNYQNPYMYQQMQQVQQVQQPQMFQQQQSANVPGRFVNDFSEITANDVPMDGRSAIFAKNDLSEINVRAWNANGTISNLTFKPVLQTNPNEVSAKSEETKFEPIMKRLDTIEEWLLTLIEKKEGEKK